MTRKQEILQQANAEAKANRIAFPEVAVKKGFIHGAEWADKTMIEKACEFIKGEKWKYTDSREGTEQIIEDFCKAMEE